MKEETEVLKLYYVQNNIGYAKYTVSYHDGVKRYKDGSRFYDLRIFGNKKELAKFIKILTNDGYLESGRKNIMKDLDFRKELKTLRALEYSYPPRTARKPVRNYDDTNAEYGRQLDEHETKKAAENAAWLEHKKLVDAQASIVKQAVLQDIGIENHPRVEKIWEYAWRETHSSGPYIDTHALIVELLEVFGE